MFPRVIMHNAVSVDGRFDWIEPDLAAFYGIAAGFREDATLVGSETILAAYPAEQAESGEEPSGSDVFEAAESLPLLVVPDSRGRIRVWSKLLGEPYWRAGVALCSRSTPRDHLDYLERAGVGFIVAGDDRVDMKTALEELAERFGVRVVRADCGGTLNGVLLRAGLVDEVSLVVDPIMVGGISPRSLFVAPDLEDSGGTIPLELESLERMEGGSVWLHYRVIRERV